MEVSNFKHAWLTYAIVTDISPVPAFPSYPIKTQTYNSQTVSLEGASNSLVSIWVGCDQWQRLCLNPDGLLVQRLSLCYESAQ